MSRRREPIDATFPERHLVLRLKHGVDGNDLLSRINSEIASELIYRGMDTYLLTGGSEPEKAQCWHDILASAETIVAEGKTAREALEASGIREEKIMFQKAVKHEAKLRLAIDGPSGGGKTYTALAVATALGKKIAVIDTERGSASKYADLFQFDRVELGIDPKDPQPFHPDKYIAAIKAAGDAGYDVLIIDSLSHAWNGRGGILELVEQFAKKSRSGNSYTAWAEGTPIQNKLIDALMAAPMHLIATMRSKQDYILEKDEKTGKTAPRKLGLAPVQREGVEYEFDVWLSMDLDNTGIVQKTRCSALAGAVMAKPGKDLAERLAAWLNGEKTPEKPVPKAEPEKKAESQKQSEKAEQKAPAGGNNGNGELTASALWKRTSTRFSVEEFQHVAKWGLGFPEKMMEYTPDNIKDWNEWLLRVEGGDTTKDDEIQKAKAAALKAAPTLPF